MSKQTLIMTDSLYEYLVHASVREHPLLARLREETDQLPMARMQIAPEQGQFMALLARLVGCRRYLEVGVFTGYSSLAVALAMPADGRVTALDVSEEWTHVARRYWREAGLEDRIDLRLAPAMGSLDDLLAAGEAGSYDMAFIDADKANYEAYYERALALVRPGGLIAIDNVLWGGAVADPADHSPDTAAIRAVTARVIGDARVHASLVPIADGLLLARKA